MTLDQALQRITGPYGAIFLLLVGVVVLWREWKASQQREVVLQGLLARQQDLFEKALEVIKDDLVPLVRDRTSLKS